MSEIISVRIFASLVGFFTNLGNTCYLNSVLQILFQVNTVVPFAIWINHLLLVDKIQCANGLSLLAFYKFLYLCKVSTIPEGELADFVYLLKTINPFLTIKLREMPMRL